MSRINIAVEPADFGTIRTVTTQIGPIANMVAKQEAFWEMKRLAKKLQEYIRTQKWAPGRTPKQTQAKSKKEGFVWAALSERYLRWKKRRGLDPRILIATGEYVKNIGIEKVKGHFRKEKGKKGIILVKPEDGKQADGKDVAYVVCVPDRKHQASGLNFRRLARIHEFGSVKAHIPARPHWRPLWKEFKSDGRKKLVKKIMSRTKKEVKLLLVKMKKTG
mgnify:CR=1 FL=1